MDLFVPSAKIFIQGAGPEKGSELFLLVPERAGAACWRAVMPSLFALMLRAQRTASATPQPWSPGGDQQGLSSAPVQNFATPKGSLGGYSL